MYHTTFCRRPSGGSDIQVIRLFVCTRHIAYSGSAYQMRRSVAACLLSTAEVSVSAMPERTDAVERSDINIYGIDPT